jgi:hypothetical protein
VKTGFTTIQLRDHVVLYLRASFEVERSRFASGRMFLRHRSHTMLWVRATKKYPSLTFLAIFGKNEIYSLRGHFYGYEHQSHSAT